MLSRNKFHCIVYIHLTVYLIDHAVHHNFYVIQHIPLIFVFVSSSSQFSNDFFVTLKKLKIPSLIACGKNLCNYTYVYDCWLSNSHLVILVLNLELSYYVLKKLA